MEDLQRQDGFAPDGQPLFIAREDMDPDRTYYGYEAGGDGIYHWTTSITPGSLGTNDLRVKDVRINMPTEDVGEAWGVQPNRRRTPQERTESLATRLAAHFDKFGLSESLVAELQSIAWKAGNPITSEECQALATHLLTLREQEAEDEDSKHVVRSSPYVVDPAPVNREPSGQAVVPVITGG